MSALPEMTMPPAPEVQVEPSDVRSESVNYDDAEVKHTSKIDEVLEQTKKTIRQRREEVPEIGVVEGAPDNGELDTEPTDGILNIKPVIDDADIFKDAPPKRPKKARSQKQLEHLKKAREKALVTRKANKAKKDMAKKKVEFDEVLEHTDDRPPQAKQESLLLHLTRAELKELQEQAIEGYDTRRKARKQVKREAQEEVRKANLVNQSVRNAYGMPKQPDPDDMWAECFR